MSSDRILVVYDLVRAAVEAKKTFPEIVGGLSEIGVERYHADYSRGEQTVYFADGESVVVTVPWGEHPMGREFLASVVESAVKQSQRGEHTYIDFVRKTMAAGCVGYFVQIRGKRVDYFGRNGEVHTEWFPGAG